MITATTTTNDHPGDYRVIRLLKRSGGWRVIYVPGVDLRARLKPLVADLTRRSVDRCPAAHAFAPGRSPVTAARLHRGREITISWDLAEWFDHVRRDQIAREGVEDHILDVILIGGAPRQGLPTSPAASNLAAAELDRQIVFWLGDRGVYTRYADDLTISVDDPALARELLAVIPALVRQQGWRIHPKKTQIQYARAGRRVICGVAVDDGDQTHATRRARRRLRAAQHAASLPVRDRERAAAQARGLAEWCAQRIPAQARLDERLRSRGRAADLAAALEISSRRSQRFAVRSQIEEIDLKSYGRAIRVLSERIDPTTKDHESVIHWAAALAITFGSQFGSWIRDHKDQELHDLCYWLPVDLCRDLGLELGSYLFRVRKEIPDLFPVIKDLSLIAKFWGSLTPEERSEPISDLAPKVRSRISYPKARDLRHAAAAILADVDPDDYGVHERRWLRGIAAITYESIPVIPPIRWSKYTAIMLERDDPRRLYAGQYVDCCQHPDHPIGRSCAWHAATDPDGALLWIEHKNCGIVAQSWVWRSGDVIVADNCETLGDHGDRLADLYEIWAKSMIGRLGITEVRIGTSGDLKIPKDRWPKIDPLVHPASVTHSDARKQRRIAVAEEDDPLITEE